MIFDKEREIAGMVSSASVPRETQAIDRPVSTGRDAHAGPDRVWVDSWKSQKRLPDAVRITVRDTVLNRVLAASTAVRIKVTAQGVQKPEAKSKSAEAPPGAATQAVQPEPQQ